MEFAREKGFCFPVGVVRCQMWVGMVIWGKSYSGHDCLIYAEL